MLVAPVRPVEPGRGSRRRRIAAVVALGAPVVLLGAVVALGALGPRPAPMPIATPIASRAVTQPSTPPSGRTSSPGLPAAATRFPDAIETIPVRSVADVAADPPVDGRVTAVAGTLALVRVSGCDPVPAPADATFCPREAWLLAPDRTQHLALEVAPGVRLPRGSLPTNDPADPTRFVGVPVVGLVRNTGQAFQLERVAWLAGARWRAPSIDPALGRNPFDDGWWQRRLRAEAALDVTARNGSVVMLVTAYLRLPALEAADRTVAEIVRHDAPDATGHALWYVRALLPGGAGEGTPRGDEVRWVVVDDWTGAVVARGAE